ncbi:hypothetical protein JOD17_002980 [Geomicrobium sediminis]|uniref:Uncharacterized protein n=1 Tax=Geomicrobium sediminis TaxID=1347788 RepID=A0ABS2PEX7_9BACL|nr:hypothetical protein [Geomicrobium sediminis]
MTEYPLKEMVQVGGAVYFRSDRNVYHRSILGRDMDRLGSKI